ncbi:hypothetical protein PINS_up012224 [Pythium insidiosum]|nr:hypothetical protein PINS_up012224 [Pythium insidiosum]
MNQEDFRRLVATRSSGDSTASGDGQYGGSRKLSAQDLESIRKLSAKKTKKKDRSREHKSSLNREKLETATSGGASQSQYRDRAAERRQGIQISEDIDDLKKLTRDSEKERAAVVKGLDFALLAQLKREKERLEKATAAAKAKTQPDPLGDDDSLREPTFKTRLGRLVFYHALQTREEQATKSELFLPGRMTYTFDVTSSSYESIPTTVQRSKEDCPEPEDMLCGQVDELLISRVASALDAKRQQKSIRRKTSRHQDQESASGKNDSNTEALTGNHGPTAIGDKAVQDSVDDDDIFPDAGEYVPAYMREEERAVESKAAASRGSYFSDLSASLSAAEAAERRKEKEAQEAWKATLKKAVIAQTEAEREKERKARAAKLAAQEDTYSECFPEYQGAAADDSDDEEAASKKKRKGAGESETAVDEEELSRRKRQKHQNKLENDLHKINKLLETKSNVDPTVHHSIEWCVPGLLADSCFSTEEKMADEIALARERLAAKFGDVRTGGKGTVRRKRKAAHKATAADDKKLSATLKKLGVTNIPGVEEVNLFKADGQVIHFAAPKVQASIASNTYAVSGHCATKSLQELLPGIINQLGPDNLANLKQIAESYTAAQKAAKAAAPADDEDDDDVPDLVDNFEDVSQQD